MIGSETPSETRLNQEALFSPPNHPHRYSELHLHINTRRHHSIMADYDSLYTSQDAAKFDLFSIYFTHWTKIRIQSAREVYKCISLSLY